MSDFGEPQRCLDMRLLGFKKYLYSNLPYWRVILTSDFNKNFGDLNKDLVFEFFGVFSYFECSLKKCCYAKNTVQNQRIEICWKRFCDKHIQVFNKIDKEMITYFSKNPPKKQVISDEGLKWCDDNHDSQIDFERLLILVRRVRNNLFHGGKYNIAIEQLERNNTLLRYSVSIIESCIDSLREQHANKFDN